MARSPCSHAEQVPCVVSRRLKIDQDLEVAYKVPGLQCRRCRRKTIAPAVEQACLDDMRRRFTPRCEKHVCARCGQVF